jgi:hypothetical protein
VNGFKPKRDMINYRTYLSLVCLTKLESSPDYLKQLSSLKSACSTTSEIQPFYSPHTKVQYLYAIGGKSLYDGKKGPICQLKTIERYDIERNEWVEIRTQLTYGRTFSSAITFSHRYIYVIGGSTGTDCIEIIDTEKENTV